MDTPEFVARPANVPRPRTPTPVLARLIETATNGQAVRVPLNGQHASDVGHRFRQLVAYHGYFLRARKDGDALICWAEKKPEKGGA